MLVALDKVTGSEKDHKVSGQISSKQTGIFYSIPEEHGISSNQNHIGLSATEIELLIPISGKSHLSGSSTL